MKTIKVQLDFNITKRIHSLYHSFFNNPPEGVEYVKSEFRGINEKNYSYLGKIYKKTVKIFPFVSRFHQNIIDILRKEKGIDLIHFTFHLGETKKPCVVDYENVYNFIKVNETEDKRLKNKAINRINKKNIKYLMPIHNEALKSFKLLFGNSVNKPQEIVYPTIFIPEEFRKNIKKENKIIFISTSNITDYDDVFLIKGGYETILAFEQLSKKYSNWEFLVLGKIPKYLERKFPKNLIFKEGVPREEMWNIFNKSKIFVQPCYQAPAMSFIEAMWLKLPIITYDCWANNEYVNKDNGILIQPEKIDYINKYNIPEYSKETFDKIRENSKKNSKKIKRAIEKLIKNDKLREKLGNNGFKEVLEDKFSIDKKNEKLRKIYKEALS